MAAGMLCSVHKCVRLYCIRFFSSKLNNILKEMPKDKSHITILRKERINKSNIQGDASASFVQLCVLGNASKGNPRALFVSTDHINYLFNCGEGTQRLALEHK